MWHFFLEKIAFFRARRIQNTAKTHYAGLKMGSSGGKIDRFSAKKVKWMMWEAFSNQFVQY